MTHDDRLFEAAKAAMQSIVLAITSNRDAAVAMKETLEKLHQSQSLTVSKMAIGFADELLKQLKTNEDKP
jgi:hypothetical protein